MDYTDLPFTDCLLGDESAMLLFALDRVHRQYAWKTAGLDAAQLRHQHPPSRMTIAGLIKHLTAVEERWTAQAHGFSPRSPWDDAKDEWDWQSAVSDDPDELYAQWYATVARCRQVWVESLSDGGLDVRVGPDDDSYVVNRRRVLVDILEENLQHTGHASVLRQAVDGLTGNDPP